MNRGRSTKPVCRSRSAFTLVELIVAAGITIGIAGVMITIVTNVMSSASRSSGALLSNNQAKIALDFLAQDLQSTAMRADDNVWLAATVQPDQAVEDGDSGAGMARWTATGGGTTKPTAANGSLVLEPASALLEDYRFGMAGMWLRFFTTEPDSNVGDLANLSAPRAVSYQIVRYLVQNDVDSSLRYGLFRTWVRPYDSDAGTATRSVFLVGFDLFAENYNDPAVGGTTPGDAGTIRRPNRTHLIANDVVDFGVRFWTRNTAGELILLYPADGAGNPDETNLAFAATADESASQPVSATAAGLDYSLATSYGFPVLAEVFLRVLTDEGSRQIEALERGRLGGVPPEYASYGEWWWSIVEANSRVYTRWVEMKGRPL